MKHTNSRFLLMPFAAAALLLGACGTSTSRGSEPPVNVGAEPPAEQPILEPGDTAAPIEGTDPTGSADLVVSSDDGSSLPVHVGAQPPAEKPVLEPGDELIYSTDPIDLDDA
jgi:hypothetical protein